MVVGTSSLMFRYVLLLAVRRWSLALVFCCVCAGMMYAMCCTFGRNGRVASFAGVLTLALSCEIGAAHPLRPCILILDSPSPLYTNSAP